MTTIGMYYDVIAGKEKEFEQVFERTIRAMRDIPGHVHSALYSSVAEPGSYVILSEWLDRPTFDAFVQSQAFKAITTWGKTQILRSRPQHKIYRSE